MVMIMMMMIKWRWWFYDTKVMHDYFMTTAMVMVTLIMKTVMMIIKGILQIVILFSPYHGSFFIKCLCFPKIITFKSFLSLLMSFIFYLYQIWRAILMYHGPLMQSYLELQCVYSLISITWGYTLIKHEFYSISTWTQKWPTVNCDNFNFIKVASRFLNRTYKTYMHLYQCHHFDNINESTYM